MRGLGILAAGAALVVLLTSAIAAAESVVVSPGPPLTAKVTVSPKVLPKRERSPAALDFDLRVNPAFDDVLPPAKELALDLDGNVVLDLTGYPACSPRPQVQSAPPPPLSEECEAAIAGWGSAGFEIRPPGAEPVAISSPLRLLNAGRSNGVRRLVGLAEVAIPVPAQIPMTIEIRRVWSGRYGTRFTIALPKVAGGTGALTHLRFRLGKRFLHEGRRKSLVRARCPDGKLLADLEVLFVDDGSYGESLVRPCTGKG